MENYKNQFKYTVLALIVMIVATVTACSSDDDDKDMTPPTISSQGITANPINCQQYQRGDVIPFHYVMNDNQELGAYNIEIHSNFDHHSHSTEADHNHGETECDDDEHESEHEHEGEHEQTAWVYNQDFTIPAGLHTFDARQDIKIPDDIATGDYHFMVRLTDRAGWQQLHAVAIKIVE